MSISINTFNNISQLKQLSLNEYLKNGDDLKQFALDFLKKTDFNITDYKIFEANVPDEYILTLPDFIKKEIKDYKPKFLNVLLEHNNSDFSLNIEEESLGTQVIFNFIPFIRDAINNQKVIIVDELDKSLHPFLVQYIVEMFNNSEVNKTGAQLIFNTHDTNLLDLNLLRRDQIWFTEKNAENGVSDLYSLADFSVRKSENAEKGYLLGRYGAIPFITNDINLWEDE